MDIERNRPLQEDTIFRIYSMTKPLTSLALMMLVEEGRVSLDDPVGRFVEGWAGGKERCTLRHVLTHTGGFPMYRDKAFDREISYADTIARIRTNGYDIFLMLDAVVALSKHNGAGAPGLTRQDRHFLKSLKIRLDEEALEAEAQVEARPTITPQDVKFLRSLRISSDDLF